MDQPDIAARLDRIERDIAAMKNMQMAISAVLQMIAMRIGVSAADIQSGAPVTIATPFDIADEMKRRDQPAGL